MFVIKRKAETAEAWLKGTFPGTRWGAPDEAIKFRRASQAQSVARGLGLNFGEVRIESVRGGVDTARPLKGRGQRWTLPD
jgi:hypothetical protein